MESTTHYPKFRLGKREFDPFPYWIALLIIGFFVGGLGAYEVLTKGLIVTDLSNQISWGLWIVFDISSIALGGSAFVFGVIVYILKIKRFEVIGRLAVLLGFLGYSAAGMILLMDLGQPLRFWHPVVFWQPHSLLWEITMCVVLYLTVLVAELVPMILEHPIFTTHPLLERSSFWRKISDVLQNLAHFLHKIGPGLAILGMTLSILHQASLGATYGVLSGRGLWFSPSAPVEFVLSAMGGGSALLFILSVFVFRVMRPGLVKDETFYALARLAGSIILLCIYIRLWDWAVTNYYSFDNFVALQTELLNTITPYSAFFWIGQVFFAFIPGLVLLNAKKIKNFKALVAIAIFPVICLVLMRWNYNFAGVIASISYDPFTPEVILHSYTPTWQEWAVVAGVASYWLMGFSLAARFLPFKSMHKEH